MGHFHSEMAAMQLMSKQDIQTHTMPMYYKKKFTCRKFTNKRGIKFRIRPESTEDGLILYAAESEKAYGDFLAVIIKDKYIELRYNVGGSKFKFES